MSDSCGPPIMSLSWPSLRLWPWVRSLGQLAMFLVRKYVSLVSLGSLAGGGGGGSRGSRGRGRSSGCFFLEACVEGWERLRAGVSRFNHCFFTLCSMSERSSESNSAISPS